MSFLRRHAPTYFPVTFEAALKTIESFEIVSLGRGEAGPFAPPRLVSRAISVHGSGSPYLHDDLSERIYVAYLALKGWKFSKVRERIAQALNHAKIPRRLEQVRLEQGWTYADVNDRIKEYKKRRDRELREALPLKEKSSFQKQQLEDLIDTWVHRFQVGQVQRAAQKANGSAMKRRRLNIAIGYSKPVKGEG